jgi:hypothetical protein
MGENLLFSGRGKVLVADHGSKKFRWLGNCTGLSIAPSEEKTDHREMYSGNDLVDQTLRRRRKITVSANLESYSLANLILAMHGNQVSVTGDTVSAESFPEGLVVGDLVELVHPKLTDVVLTDSTPVTPVTLTLNTHYSLNANHGSVEILSLAGLTQPIKAAYTYATVTGTGLLTKTSKLVVLRFEGLNIAVDDGTPDPVLVRLYKVSVDPAELPLIQDEYGTFTLSGEALLDSTKSAAGALGQVGEIFHLS